MDGIFRLNVAVIGAGAIGLKTATHLAERGHRVDVYADDFSPATTSNGAPALVFPYAVEPTREVREAARRTLRWCEAEVAAGSPVRTQRHYEFVETMDEAQRGILPFVDLFDGVTVVPPSAVPAPYKFGWVVDTYFIDTRLMMPYLMWRAAAAGVRFERRSFADRADIEALPARYQVIANCSGLGARHLFNDEAVCPIKGQLVVVPAVALPYTVIHGPYYAFPRGDDCVLGGTQELGEWDLAPSEAATQRILDGNRIFIPDLDARSVRRVRTGLRPYRHGGPRLELERAGDRLIAHNYGHGGSGWSIGWGCAELLTERIEQALTRAPAPRTA